MQPTKIRPRTFADPKQYAIARRSVLSEMRLYPRGVSPALVSLNTGLSISETTEILVREATCNARGVWS